VNLDVHFSQKSANGACWSPFIETLIASVNEDSLFVWDIARNSYVNYQLCFLVNDLSVIVILNVYY